MKLECLAVDELLHFSTSLFTTLDATFAVSYEAGPDSGQQQLRFSCWMITQFVQR